MDLLVTLFLAALLALIPASIASGKGRSFGAWYLYGFFLFIVALIHSLAIRDEEVDHLIRSAGTDAPQGSRRAAKTPFSPAEAVKRCPDCAETIKAEARVCRFCRHNFTDEEIAASVAEAELKHEAVQPPAPDIDYWTRGGGYIRGPFSEAEMVEMISSGSVTRSHEIAEVKPGLRPRGPNFNPAHTVAVWNSVVS